MQIIQNILKKIITSLYSIEIEHISLENPPKPELGDYAFACFLLARELKKGPPQIASEIKAYFDEHKQDFSDISQMEFVGGYLNLRLKNEAFTHAFLEAVKDTSIFANFENKGETIIVDYIGANVGKPLHIGHMCTPNIGQTLINLYKKLGYDVISDSHIGDWGIIFGKLILAYKLYGDEKRLKENAINHLLELYIRITEGIEKEKNSPPLEGGVGGGNLIMIPPLTPSPIKLRTGSYEGEEYPLEQQIRDTFKLLSEGDVASIKLWETFTKESIRFMNIQLGRLGVQPDYNIGESFYEGLGLPKIENYPDLKWDMKSIVRELIDKSIATKNDDGSVGVVFSEESKLPSCILQKRDGTHGYLASDLSAIKYRSENWHPSKIIYSVDIRQELHFKQAFYIAKAAGWFKHSVIPNLIGNPEKIDGANEQSISDSSLHSEGQKIETELFHAANGFISLKDGAMSTRTGKIIRLEALLDEAEERAKKIILEKRQDIQGTELEKLSKIIGIGAIKYGYLSKSRLTNVVFDWDEFMTFEGNSGPYIQYAYVRAKSVLGDTEIVIPSLTGNLLNEVGENKQDLSDPRISPGYPLGVFQTHSPCREDDKTGARFETLEEKELVKTLFEYKHILLQATRENFPHIIAGYSYELTKKFSSLYAKVPLQNETDEGKRILRLLLISTFSQILKECFSILAIDMPERM